MFIPLSSFLFTEATDEGQSGGDGPSEQQQAPVYFNGDGSFGENWHVGLGDEFSPHADTLKNFKNVGGLAKSYLHMRSSGPQYPSETSTPEDIERFHALAKVPVNASAEAYGVQIPADLPEAAKKSYERVLSAAHAHHAPAPVVAAIVKEFQAAQAEEYQVYEDAIAADRKAKQDALVGDWRGNYDSNMSTVRHWATKMAEQAGVDPNDEEFKAMQQHPAFAKVMLQVAKLSSEDSIRQPANLGDLRSPQQQAEAIMSGADPVWGKKYTEGTSEERVAAYNEVVRLQNLAKS